MTQTEDDAAAATVERAAVGLLADREHSRAELTRKLRMRRHAIGLIDQVLDDLERRGLLSDERFAAHYVAWRLDKGRGPLRIRAELEARGVAGRLIASALDEAALDWEARLAEVALRKFGTDPVESLHERARRGRFLTQRGFPVGLVHRYLDQAIEQAARDTAN